MVISLIQKIANKGSVLDELYQELFDLNDSESNSNNNLRV